jgi:hypothetical protein
MASSYPAFLRCKDNTLVRSLLTVGQVYECSGEQDHNYFVAGKWLTKGRFEPATIADWIAQRAQR